MITSKPYRCINCGKEWQSSTNHFGNIYSCSPCCKANGECCLNPDESRKTAFSRVKKGIREIERMLTKSRWSNGQLYTAKYGFYYFQGNSRPYFSITVDIKKKAKNGRLIWVGGGAAHNDIARVFPELEHLIKWHCVDDRGANMHAVANACYWLELEVGVSQWKHDGRNKPLDNFKSTVVFGALPEDTDTALHNLLAPLAEGARAELLDPQIALKLKREELRQRVVTWFKPRLPKLAARMREDMLGAEIQYINESEYTEDAT